MLAGLAAVVSTFLLPFVFSSPNHDEFQESVPLDWAHQEYLSKDARRLAKSSSIGNKACSEVHASAPFAPLRVGWEFIDFGDVPTETLDFVDKVIMTKSASYWMQALEVRRATEPLRVERTCNSAVTLSWGDGEKETTPTCMEASPPTCGSQNDNVEIPSKFYKSQKVCSKRCEVGYGDSCPCNTGAASCPSDCSPANAIDFGSKHFLCEECTTDEEGEGAVDFDLYLFATIKDTATCGGATVAYAGSCVLDQCDRPIFGYINFCKSSITVGDESLVATGVHELSHVLGFASSMYKFFRNADGSPKVPRTDDGGLQGQVTWTCSSSGWSWDVSGGNKAYVDIGTSSIGIIKQFSERGVDSCNCPINSTTMGSRCLVSGSLREPHCIVKMITPKVLEKARDHFDCPTLNGAELENQPTSSCTIFGSHWEQRLFMGELMSAVKVDVAQQYVSSVTLALFEDSGWYKPNYSMADSLVKGVHWGYHEGCSFVQDKCFSNGVTSFSRNWCVKDATSCCFDRSGECKCGTNTYTSALPSSLTYFTEYNLGVLAEPDYCPFYSVTLSNRVCTKSDSQYEVAKNANIMRETFASNSRCFESTLRGDYPAESGGVYKESAHDFSEARSGCYQIFCLEGDTAYDVVIADGTLEEGTVRLGTCNSDGEALTLPSLKGQITCVAPEIMCGARPSKMFNAPIVTKNRFNGSDAQGKDDDSKYLGRAADRAFFSLPFMCFCLSLMLLRVI